MMFSKIPLIACVLLQQVYAQCNTSVASSNHSITQKIQAASDAWIYGVPALAIQQTRNFYLAAGAQLNVVLAAPGLANAAQRSIVRPNADTIYSIAFFDLSQGPVMLQIPKVTDRYFVAAMYDAYTNQFAAPGTLYDSPAGIYTLVGPQDASCVQRTNFTIMSPTNDVWMIARFYVLNATTGSADLDKISSLQQQLRVVSSPTSIMSVMPGFSNQTSQTYQAYYALNQAVSDNPIQPAQYDANYSIAGLQSGRSFRSTISAGNLTSAQAMANDTIANSVLRPGAIRALNNGWVIPTTIGQYGNDYAARAYITGFGLGALTPDQAIYPTYVGGVLSSVGNQTYSITFPDGEPPTTGQGFWSLTLYDQEGFFVQNDINRYSLGSRDILDKNVNGSYTIQASYLPPSGSTRNWLPAPKEQTWVPTLRVYGATAAVAQGDWTYPVISKL